MDNNLWKKVEQFLYQLHYLGHDYDEMTEQYIDYTPRKIAKANTEFFEKPGNSLAASLKKGGKYGK